MNPRTSELLRKLEQADWFSNCGLPLEANAEVQPLQGWREAMEVCPEPSSKAARLESSNELTVQLSARHDEAYELWNAKVAEVKPLMERIVREKLASPSVRARMPDEAEKVFLNALRWDLLGLCMAREYEDLVPRTRYYELVEHWFLAGRFPCGWIGEVPEDMAGAFAVGKLAVL